MIKLTKEMQDTKEKVNELCDKMARAQKAFDNCDNSLKRCDRILRIADCCVLKAADLAYIFCNTFENYVFNVIAVNKLIKSAENCWHYNWAQRRESVQLLYFWKSVLLERYMAKQLWIDGMPSDFDEVELEND